MVSILFCKGIRPSWMLHYPCAILGHEKNFGQTISGNQCKVFSLVSLKNPGAFLLNFEWNNIAIFHSKDIGDFPTELNIYSPFQFIELDEINCL